MHVRHRKYRNFALLTLAVILYFLLRKRKQHFYFEYDVAQTSPVIVWEYVADFSNMKFLNPTIKDFNIISESGNYDHWEYRTEYTELLSHFPYVSNLAHADFIIKPDGNDFIIASKHRTCFFSSFCVNSDSEFRFSQAPHQSTRCREKIFYECPTIFSSFCELEVRFQRTAIRDNLKKHFTKNGSHNM